MHSRPWSVGLLCVVWCWEIKHSTNKISNRENQKEEKQLHSNIPNWNSPISDPCQMVFSNSRSSSSSRPVGGSITLRAFLCSFTSIPLVRTCTFFMKQSKITLHATIVIVYETLGYHIKNILYLKNKIDSDPNKIWKNLWVQKEL